MSIDPEIIKLKEDLANYIIEKIKSKMKQEGKIDSGIAAECFDYYENDSVVGTFLDYMYNIEYGRFAGSHVPIKPLAEWAMSKVGVDEKNAYAFAKYIEHMIYEEGITPSRVVKKVLEDLEHG